MILGEFSLSQLYSSNLELFGLITGVICVGLITFEKASSKLAWWNWPIGILTSGVYVYIFYDYALYFNSALQVFYVITGFYGAWYWFNRGEDREWPPVHAMSLKWTALYSVACLASAVTLAAGFDALGVDSAAPFWDALVVTFSLCAQFIMTRKYREHWFFWMVVDIVGVALFWSQGLYATSLLYFIYGGLVVRGIFTWNAKYRIDSGAINASEATS